MNYIKHFLVESPMSLRLFLTEKAMISIEDADFLISMGAVYKNRLRTVEDTSLVAGDLIRCHTRPRRFISELNIDKHILFENNDFMIIDKPAGLPCQASLDNRIENVLYILSQHTQQKLLITHRLDVGTEGLLVIAKNQVFQRNFNHQLETRQVVKIYEALTIGTPLSPGKKSHWMLSHPRAPKILKSIEENRADLTDGHGHEHGHEHGHGYIHEQKNDPMPASDIENDHSQTDDQERKTHQEREQEKQMWKRCELEILSSASIPALHSLPLPLPEQTIHFSCNRYRLQLHTGRTHQIRAQLSFMNNPIIGDTLYGGSSLGKNTVGENSKDSGMSVSNPSAFIERYALSCSELHFTFQGIPFQFHRKENFVESFFKKVHRDLPR